MRVLCYYAAILASCVQASCCVRAESMECITAEDLYVQSVGSGTPVVCIHGFGANTATWSGIVPALSEHSTVYLIDLKGFGKSPKPADKKYSVTDQARLIVSFVQNRDLHDVTLIGHSFGGAVALFAALELQEIDPSRITALVLIDSAAYRHDFPTFIKLLRFPIIGPTFLRILPARFQARKILKTAYYDESKIKEELVEAYAAPLRRPGGCHALIQTARQIVPPNIDDITPRYGELDLPTLIIWGENDGIIPLSNGRRLAESLPKAKLIVLAETGHNAHEERPEQVRDAILQFLAN